jgi:hypothetical protein
LTATLAIASRTTLPAKSHTTVRLAAPDPSKPRQPRNPPRNCCHKILSDRGHCVFQHGSPRLPRFSS